MVNGSVTYFSFSIAGLYAFARIYKIVDFKMANFKEIATLQR